MHDKTLAEADKIIAGDRRVEYGDAQTSFEAVAQVWTWYLRTKFKVDITLTGIDVALIMDLFKISRNTTGEPKLDNFIDICGYTALGARFLQPAVVENPVENTQSDIPPKEKSEVEKALEGVNSFFDDMVKQLKQAEDFHRKASRHFFPNYPSDFPAEFVGKPGIYYTSNKKWKRFEMPVGGFVYPFPDQDPECRAFQIVIQEE